jgi:ABC-type cobalamin/Fe3+-siderophores transport system ATPase subunit
MIVELFGPSGSGKSTIARSLAASSRVTRMRITSRRELLLRGGLYTLSHPLQSLMQMLYLIRYAGSLRLFRTKFINLFLQHAAKRQKAERASGTVLIDQGHLQNLLSLFDAPQAEGVLRAYVKWLPKPDLVVVVAVDERVLDARLQERGLFVRPDETEDQARERVIASRENFRRAQRVLGAMSGLKQETISTVDDITAL